MIAFIATAGSGKTSSLVERAKIHPFGVALTYTRRMAKELERRMPKSVRCSTFHSLAGHIYSRVYGRPAPKLGDDYYVVSVKDRKDRRDDTIKNTMRSCVNAIQRDPMILHQWCIFQGYTSLFIDEAQDLSEELFLFVCHLVDAGLDLYIAGDPYQSIYQFMGGDVAHMEELTTRYSLHIEELNINYRSTQNIVDTANALTGLDSTAASGTYGQPVEFFRLNTNSEQVAFLQKYGGTLADRVVISPWRFGFDNKLYVPSPSGQMPIHRALGLRTIHSIKGEEFNDVTLIFDGRGLDKLARDDTDEVTVRNLMYVGITRAIDSLHIVQIGDVQWRVLDGLLEHLSIQQGLR